MASVADLRRRIDKERPDCPRCRKPMYDLGVDAYASTPDGGTRMVYACSGECTTSIGTAVQINRVFYLSDDRPSRDEFLPAQQFLPDQDTTSTTSSSGGNMAHGGSTSTGSGSATGEVHDVESCDAQLDALDDDLDAMNNAVDAIDTAVGDALSAVERMRAWLQKKNVDQAVTGMDQVADVLNPDSIKAIIDAVAGAKAGVQTTRDGLAPLREARDLVGDADGSAINGR